jgi:hypothetical protein
MGLLACSAAEGGHFEERSINRDGGAKRRAAARFANRPYEGLVADTVASEP